MQKMHTKELIMKKALLQAQLAMRHNEVPIGAVIVDAGGVIIARGYNKIEAKNCQTAHAEIIAIQKACKKIGDWRLNGCWIYVTLEPCLMCIGLIQLSRIEGIVFAALSPLFGSGLSNPKNLPLYAKHLEIERGIGEEKSIQLLQAFFKNKRKKRKGGSESEGRLY